MKDKYTELSERQREVCERFLWFKGEKYWKEKASKIMHISINTLKTHLSEIYSKLCVESQAELMHKLLTEGF